MSARPCQVCGAEVPDGITMCETDAEELLTALYSVPAVIEDLRTTFARLDNMRGPGRSVGKSTETPLPWNDRVPQRLDALTEVLVRWARPVARARQLDSLPHIPYARDPKDPARVPGAITTAGLAARLLSESWTTVRTMVNAGEAHEEITDAIRQAQRTVDRPAERRFLGLCSVELPEDAPTRGDDGRCTVDLYVHPRAHTASCPGCATEHDVTARRDVLTAAMLDHLDGTEGTAAEVAGWLRLAGVEVGTSTVRRWAAKKLIAPVRSNGRGHPVYRVGAVMAQFRQMHPDTPKVGELAS